MKWGADMKKELGVTVKFKLDNHLTSPTKEEIIRSIMNDLHNKYTSLERVTLDGEVFMEFDTERNK